MTTDFKKKLNKQQLAAVEYEQGPSLILAGAGSGKTRVLGYKAMYLLAEKNIKPEHVLMLTFTNKAADEMKQRIKRYIKPELQPENITASTFHSFCTRLLRRYGLINWPNRDFVIFDDQDQKDLLKDILKEGNLKFKISPGALLYQISQAKAQLLEPADLKNQGQTTYEKTVAILYDEYQKRLREVNALDFDDLLMEAINLLQKSSGVLESLHQRYIYILIDEYQDTNHAQYMIARLLAKKNHHITVVGDFAQSIYSWRGADFRNLHKFQRDFPQTKVFNLEQNYRSTQPILNFAYKVISQNTTHPVLKLYTNKEKGEEIEIVPLEKAEQEAIYVINKAHELNLNGNVSLQDMAILYRTNAQSRSLEESCLSKGLPYQIFGGIRFYKRKEIKDILAFLRYLHNPKDKVSLKRIQKLGKKRSAKIIEVVLKQTNNEKPQTIIQNILKKSPYLELYSEDDPEDSPRLDNIQELVNVAYNYDTLIDFLDTVALIESGYELPQNERDKLNLMTLHAAKGLEFSVIFIVGVEEGILPHSRSISSLEELEEERRLFYVGVTRAKEKLFITFARQRWVYGRPQYNLPSQFLIETGLVEH